MYVHVDDVDLACCCFNGYWWLFVTGAWDKHVRHVPPSRFPTVVTQMCGVQCKRAVVSRKQRIRNHTHAPFFSEPSTRGVILLVKPKFSWNTTTVVSVQIIGRPQLNSEPYLTLTPTTTATIAKQTRIMVRGYQIPE